MTIYDPPIKTALTNTLRVPTLYDYYRRALADRATLDTLRRMVEGDMWADGEGWVGPQPDPGELDSSRVMAMIEKAFASHNLLREVVTRHRDAVAGREPIWSLQPDRTMQRDEQPTAAEQALIDEATHALTAWWDERQIWAQLQHTIFDALWAGNSPLRVYVPLLHVNEDGTVPIGPLADSMLKVYAHHPPATAAGVIRDIDRVPRGAFYTYRDFWGLTQLELQALTPEGKVEIRQYTGGLSASPTSTGAVGDVIEYDLGGLLLTHDTVLEPLTSPQVVSQQKLINKSYTMLSRNVDVGGFLERTILNGQMPGEWVKQDDGSEKFIPSPYNVGAGATNFIAGIQYDQTTQAPDGHRQQAITTPSIVYNQPVAVTTFLDTIEASKAAIYQECKQMHVLMSGDATASGKSRIQATNDFTGSLETTRIQLEFTTRWLLNTVLRLAAILSGQPGKFDGLRVAVQARITAVQPDSQTIADTILLKEANLIDTEEGMTRSGVEDPTAMKARILADGQTPGTPLVPISLKGNAGSTEKAAETAAAKPADQTPNTQ